MISGRVSVVHFGAPRAAILVWWPALPTQHGPPNSDDVSFRIF